MSKGPLYHYFPSKDALLRFILKNSGTASWKGWKRSLEHIKDDLSRIRFVILRQLKISVQFQAESKTFIDAEYSLPENIRR